jgi:hypothetical protein
LAEWATIRVLPLAKAWMPLRLTVPLTGLRAAAGAAAGRLRRQRSGRRPGRAGSLLPLVRRRRGGGAVAPGPHVRAWEAEILAFHTTGGCSNGPTEAVNLLIKKVKRVGHGFRNFANYRLRLLLHCGVSWRTHRTARLRGRSPHLVA